MVRLFKVSYFEDLILTMAKTFILVFCLLLFPATQAQTILSEQIKSDVSKLYENEYKSKTGGDVEVKITGCQFSELQLPDGNITYKISSNTDRIMPRDIKRVDIYVNGNYARTLNLPAQTAVYKNVLVASDFINREQMLTKECTEVKKVDISMKSGYVLDESMLEKEITTKKVFQKGEIIDKRFVKMRPDVARNSDVRIFFVSKGAVMITIDGTAMADGMLGDYINVENRNYKKIYNGKVIGENKVLVKI